jgi:mono/diheme cytochrome c family protein
MMRFIGCCLLAASASAQTASDPITFYSSRIKPLLSARCYACHTQTAMGGLRLDSREAFVKGGNSGSALAMLMPVVTHTHAKIKMPPGWEAERHRDRRPKAMARFGRPFRSIGHDYGEGFDVEGRKNFWSFVPPVKKTPPPGPTPIDGFLLAAMNAKGLTPAPLADRRTLLRRVTLDLIGLPPTPAEYKAFIEDQSPKAFARVVDRLLLSERYGERWGRHWLDVARYADADGLSLAPDPFPNAWRYRDWVISAFNRDMRYDEFVQAQIAGDLLDQPGEHNLTPGLGYLALGPWYFRIVEPPKARADELQDRIDVVARGMLGLTVACARCHDHKYDPIPTKDYYGIGGVLAATEYKEEPLAPPATVKAYHDAERRITDLEKQIKDFLDAERRAFSERAAKESGRYMLAAWDQKHGAKELAAGLDPKLLDRWARYLDKTHDHKLLDFWPGLANRPDAVAASKAFQQAVDTLVREQQEITAYNERVIEESKKSTDPYDIFCKGCTAETRALPREKYVPARRSV